MADEFVMTTEIALKSRISMMRNLRDIAERNLTFCEFNLINMWRKLYENGLLEEVDVWFYVRSVDRSVRWHGDSRLLGIKTTIQPRTITKGKRKGQVVLFHIGFHNEIISEVKNADAVPRYYTGYFRINERAFNIDYKNLEDYEVMNLEELFIPKKGLM
jgi:hydrogenase maturation factor